MHKINTIIIIIVWNLPDIIEDLTVRSVEVMAATMLDFVEQVVVTVEIVVGFSS